MVLYVAKVLRRFLVDADGPVDTILVRCLKSKSGFGTRLQATPEHLLPHDTHFKLEDFIAGPLDFDPNRQKFNRLRSTKMQQLEKSL